MSEMVERVARAIYDLEPFYEPGECVDGFPVSPSGNLSWDQACARDAEFEGVSGMFPITRSAREAARAAIEIMRSVPDVCYDQYNLDKVWREANSREVWNAWIDAALQ